MPVGCERSCGSESLPTALTSHDSAPRAAAWIATFVGAPLSCASVGNRSHTSSPTLTITHQMGTTFWERREARGAGTRPEETMEEMWIVECRATVAIVLSTSR